MNISSAVMSHKKGFAAPSFWKRTLAFLVDLLIIDLLLTPFESAVQNIIPPGVSFVAFQGSSRLIWLMIAMSAVAVLYFALFEYKLRQSIGKMIFKLYVISDTKELKIWQAVGRSLFIIPIFPFILLWLIDPVYLIFRKRRLSEILTKTWVIEQLPPWRVKNE